MLFGFAHLMFWNWIAIGLSALGGYVFARGYLDRAGFPMAVALHALGGAIHQRPRDVLLPRGGSGALKPASTARQH